MNVLPFIKARYFDSNGDPLSGGKLYTYEAGTSTPLATYTDQGGGTANANPVVLDSNGEADIWIDLSLNYKFVLKDSDDVTQWTVDDVSGPESVATALAAIESPSTNTISGTDIDWSLGQVFTKSISGNTTFTFSGATVSKSIIVEVISSGSYTVDFPAAVKWAGGVAPTQTDTGTDVYTFVYIGGNIYGTVIQDMS